MKYRNPLIVVIFTISVLVLVLFATPRGSDLQSDSSDEIPGETEKVRSEVLDWIDDNFEGRKKTALLRLAEANQYLLAHPEEIEAVRLRVDFGMSCYSLVFEPSEEFNGVSVYKALTAKTYNTFLRAKVYMEWEDILRGGVFQPVNVERWEDGCDSKFSQ